MKGLFRLLALAAVVAIGATLPARASIAVNGQFGINSVGQPSYTPGLPSTIGSATSVTLPGVESVNFTTGDFSAGGSVPLTTGQSVTISPLTITGFVVNGGTVAFVHNSFLTFTSASVPGDTFIFDAKTINAVSSGPRNLDLDVKGFFRDSLGNYNTQFADLDFAFPQTIGGAINYSAVFSTPDIGVPELGTGAFACAMGLLSTGGMLFSRRRKTA